MMAQPVLLFNIGVEIMSALVVLILIAACVIQRRRDDIATKGLTALLIADEVYILLCLFVSFARGMPELRAVLQGIDPLDRFISLVPRPEFVSSLFTVVLFIMYCVFNVEKTIRDAGIKNELDTANKIQTALLPQMGMGKTGDSRYSVYTKMMPAKEVGGDFYDYFPMGDDKVAIVTGDVSNKGVSAALFMTVTRTLIRNHAQYGGTDSPARILEKVQQQLDEGNELSLFVTVWLGIVDLKTGKLTCCCAGHDYPAVSLGGSGYSILESKNSPALALFPWLPLSEKYITLQKGDRIFLYTDGLLEAVNGEGEEFGMDRLLSFVNAHSSLDDVRLVRALESEVRSFIGQEPQRDDITMLSFTYRDI